MPQTMYCSPGRINEVEDSLPNQPFRPSLLMRVLRVLHPSHAHSAFSATLVLMISTFLSSVFGMLRNMYIAWLFGRGMEADAFLVAFQLPDMIAYFLVGGAASITFVTILTRYRDTGREEEAHRSLSVILTTMYLVLGAAIVLAEFVAPLYVRWWFNGFDAQKAALCVHLTRILLPAQLFFFAGGVFGSVLLVRKQFNVQAVAPLIYNLGTIVGGILLVKRFGVSSLAIGTVAGAFFGPFLLNALFAHRMGARYRVILDWQDKGLREWVRMSLPLMAGVSLVTADIWIIAHFASSTSGAISLITYAKRLFTAPMAVLAQAAGAASMPFFASLWAQEKRSEFEHSVADSVSRVVCLGFLAASAMAALGVPLVSLLFVGGRFSYVDARSCAAYFAVFSISLFLWSAQAIYSRAFYAAGNTFLPMAAGTIVTAISLPIYAVFYHSYGAMGLAFASDIGIAMQTLAIAVLLHGRRMVSLARLDYREMGRCLGAAITAGAVTWLVFTWFAGVITGKIHLSTHSRAYDLIVLVAGGLMWGGISLGVLKRTGSALPRILMKRLRPA